MVKENNPSNQDENCSRCSDNGYRTYCFKDEGAKKVRIISISCQNCSISSSRLKPKVGEHEEEIAFQEARRLIDEEKWFYSDE